MANIIFVKHALQLFFFFLFLVCVGGEGGGGVGLLKKKLTIYDTKNIF